MLRSRSWAAIACIVAVGCASCSQPPTGEQVRAGSTCSTAVAPAPTDSGVEESSSGVPGSPFGVAVTGDGQWAFATAGSALVVYRVTGMTLQRIAAVPIDSPAGVAVTPDGRYVLVAEAHGVAVIDSSRARAGQSGALVATLAGLTNAAATEVAVSADGRFVFVTYEQADRLAVFALQAAAGPGPPAGRLVGTLPLGRAPVGVALSPDGRWLYVTSQSAASAAAHSHGMLSVIDAERAPTDPAHAVVATVDAGCSPVRAAVTADGATVWVTARGSNSVIGFWADKLRTDPAHARAATVDVGAEPVGLAFVDSDRWLVIGDSDRSQAGRAANLAIIDVSAALDGRPALHAYAPSGRFPRDLAAVPGRSAVIIADADSQEVQMADLTTLD